MTDRHDEDGKPYLAYFRNDLVLGFVWSGSLNDRVQVTREMGERIIETFPITGDEMWQARQAHSLESDSTQIAHAFKALCEKWIEDNVCTSLFGIPMRPALIITEEPYDPHGAEKHRYYEEN